MRSRGSSRHGWLRGWRLPALAAVLALAAESAIRLGDRVGLATTGLLLLSCVLTGVLARVLLATRTRVHLTHDEQMAGLVGDCTEGVAIVAPEGTIRTATPSLAGVLGIGGRLRGRNIADLVHAEDAPRLREFMAGAGGSGVRTPAAFRMQHAEGRFLEVEATADNRLADRAVGGLVLTIRDVGERRALERRLRHDAYRDALTGLPNRVQLLDRMRIAAMQAVVQGRSIAVLYLDLDDFKTVNDSLGHAAGDKLLTEMAERLRSSLGRPGDTAARLGGDEFAIVLNDITAPEQAGNVAQRIIESLREPFAVSDSLSVTESIVQVHTSIGIAVSDAEHHDPTELLSNADVAMYKAKERGKGRYEYFDPEMRAGALARLELKDALQGAIERGEFILCYQPIVDLADGSIVGSEALVRWQDRRRGLMRPHKWLGLAEETGLMDTIGRWVLRQACRQVRDWQLQLDNRELRVNVNLSARQLDQAGLADEIRDILFELRLSPRALVVEITEDVFMEDSTRLLGNLQSLRRTGIRLAIDDFGTGYSSLSYLRRFPVDFVKVDKSFVDDIGSAASGPALARAIIGMTHSLDLPVVAEGIERPEQLEGLRQMGCDLGQGYLFARPLDRNAMTTLLDQGVPFPLAPGAPESRLPRAGSPPATAVLRSAG